MAGGLRQLLKRKGKDHPYCAAVVPAAGSSRRMEGTDKVLAFVGEMPVLARTLLALENCPLIDEIIVVTRQDLIVPVGALCKEYALSKVRKVVQGGETRTQSVWLGLGEVDPQTELVAIHDGARPFVSQQVLEQVLTVGAQRGAAAPAVPVKDTVKIANRGVVESTPDRSRMFAVQTPQVFEASLIKGALQKALEEKAELTDDCSAVERLGMSVWLAEGSYENIKLTTPVDLAFGEVLAQWQEQG